MRYRSITGPLILIVVGFVFLFHTIYPQIHIFDFLADYWPYLLIVWGVIGLLEVIVRFARSGPIPLNGISGGAWILIFFICMAGMAAYQARRSDTWWRRASFERSVQAFGEEHDYSVGPIQKSVPANPRLVIESFRGDAKIVGTDGTDITVAGHKLIRAFEAPEAERANAQTPVTITTAGNTVVIRCNQDKAGTRAPVITNLEIAIPRHASVIATGNVGDFDISSILGDIDVSSESAGVRLQDIGGNVKIDTHRSNLIRCTNIQGNVDLRGRGTDVDLTKIAGQVTVGGDYSGSVALRELARPLEVRSMRTELRLQQLPGEIRMERGSLNLENVVGPVRLATHVTDVSIDGFSNNLEMTVDKGDVDLRPNKLPLGKIDVHTRSGNIELSLPQTAAFALSASTDHGEIDNEFGDALKEQTSGRGAHLQGAVGSGPDVRLTTDRGNVTVRKAGGQPETVKVSSVHKPAPDNQPAPVAYLRSR